MFHILLQKSQLLLLSFLYKGTKYLAKKSGTVHDMKDPNSWRIENLPLEMHKANQSSQLFIYTIEN